MPTQFDPANHHRRSSRLKGYDYSQPGAYFITLCTHQREELFGPVQDGIMCPNRLGAAVQRVWRDLPGHYPHVNLDAFCLMPNHVHAIIMLVDDDTVSCAKPMTRHPLPEIVRAFKSFSARRINAIRRTQGIPVWQRNYYEHVIRNPEEYQGIVDYIITNPARWEIDMENPHRRGGTVAGLKRGNWIKLRRHIIILAGIEVLATCFRSDIVGQLSYGIP